MSPGPLPELVVLGGGAGPRGSAYAVSLAAVGVPIRVVPYAAVLDGQPLPVRPGAVVRCEAPSDTPGLDARLVRLGGGPAVDVAAGQLVPTAAWHRGLGLLLSAVDRALADAPAHRRMQRTEAVLAMFDKAETARRLATAGVPQPEHLTAAGPDAALARDVELARDLVATGWGQAFVKPRFGSSGAGLIALRWRGRDEVIARTTIDWDGQRAGNTARLVTRRGWTAVQELIEVLRPDGLVVQRWLPKWSAGGGPCDLRVVVIAGQARHVLARIATGPVTNLHLGARRGDLQQTRRALGEEVWGRVLRVAEAAVGCFEPSLYAGVDVLVTPSGAPHVLEVNAFGDFHEGILANGLDTYQTQWAALESGWGGSSGANPTGCAGDGSAA